MLAQIIYAIFHFREYLFPLLQTLGNWSYVLIFAIIFMETGLVVFPFLPGESLIFFTSTIAAVKGSVLNIKILVVVFFLAALIGDTVNFEIGRHLKQLPFFEKHLTEAKLQTGIRFYKRHGGKNRHFRPVYSFYSDVCAVNFRNDWHASAPICLLQRDRRVVMGHCRFRSWLFLRPGSICSRTFFTNFYRHCLVRPCARNVNGHY